MRFLTRRLAKMDPDSDLDIPIEALVGGLPAVVTASGEVIEFEPGDQIIVETGRPLPRKVLNRLREDLNVHAAVDKVIVLPEGLKLVGRRKSGTA